MEISHRRLIVDHQSLIIDRCGPALGRSRRFFRRQLVLAQRFIEHLRSLLSGSAGLGNFPLYLACVNLILRDAARLSGICVDHRRSAGLKLSRTPRRHKDVPVVAVEAFD
jgi:hypothetical protein